MCIYTHKWGQNTPTHNHNSPLYKEDSSLPFPGLCLSSSSSPPPFLQSFAEKTNMVDHHRGDGDGGGISVCCMCGDVGFSDKLFRCNKCRYRLQHSYVPSSKPLGLVFHNHYYCPQIPNPKPFYSSLILRFCFFGFGFFWGVGIVATTTASSRSRSNSAIGA